MAKRSQVEPRPPLTKDLVVRAAISIADREGIGAVSMRRLGQELGVEAMSLYNHVANKDEILDCVIDEVVSEFEPTPYGEDWKSTIRARALAARSALLRHPWAPGVFGSRTRMSMAVLRYMDEAIGVLLQAGFSVALAHQAMHTLGSRLLGFTQELFQTDDMGPEVASITRGLASPELLPNVAIMLSGISHDASSRVGTGCDDQREFEFGLDLVLDGLERLHHTG